MGYYGARGDYYRGDYYRGDPFIGMLAGAGARAIAGRVGAGAGAIARRLVRSRAARAAIEQAPGFGVGMGVEQVRRSLSGGAVTRPGGTPTELELPNLGGMFGKKKYRKMNPLNPRALKRALRRAEGFEKFARRTVSGLRYGPKKFKSTKRKG